MATKTISFLDSKIVYQKKELTNPKLFELRAINKKKFWTNIKKLIFGTFCLLIIIVIVVGCIPLYFKKDPCRNFDCGNGVCISDSNGAICSCFPSYYGDRCELFDYCFNINCLNNGKCKIELNGFKCNCTNEYYGKYCESYNSCWDSPCEGCQPLKPNSSEYLCTCSRFSVSTCKSENKKEIITSLTLVELSDLRLVSSYDDNTIRILNQDNTTNILNEHNDRINALVEYKDGILVSGSCDKSIILWNTTNFKMIKKLTYHNDCVNVLLRLNILNKKILVSGSDDNRIQFWDGTSLIISIDASYPVKSLAFSETNNYLAVGTSDSTIKLWSLINYNYIIKFQINLDYTITSSIVFYRNNNKYLITGNSDGSFLVWNLTNYSIIENITGHNNSVTGLILIKNQTLVSCSYDRTIKFWNIDSFKLIKILDSTQPISTIYISSNSYLLSGSGYGLLEIWNLNTNKIVKNMSVDIYSINSIINLNNDYILIASYSVIQVLNSTFDLVKEIIDFDCYFYNLVNTNNGNFIASACGNLNVYSGATFELIFSFPAHDSRIRYLIVLQDDKLLSGNDRNIIKIWNLNTFDCLATVNINSSEFVFLALLENNLFGSSHKDNNFYLWSLVNVDLYSRLFTLFTSHSSSITALAYLDKSRLISGSSDSTIKIWDLINLFLLYTLTEHRQTITCLTLINDEMFASGSVDNKIIIWKKDASIDFILNEHQGTINSIIYSKNKSFIISSSADRNIIYWEKSYSLNKKQDLIGHKRQIEDLIALDNENLLSASDDFTIKLWNINSSTNVLTLEGHTDNVYKLLKLDNNLIASSSRDQTIIIWRINILTTSIKKIKVLYGHSKAVISLAKLKGNFLASGSCDKTINIWNLETFTLQKTLKSHKGCINDLIEFRSKYLISASNDNSINIWDINSFDIIKSIDFSISINALSASNAYFAVGLSNGSILIYSDRIKYEKNFSNPINTEEKLVSLLSYDSNIIGLSENGNIKMWNSALNLIFKNKLFNGFNITDSIIFKKELITSHDDGSIRSWNTSNNFSKLHEFNAHALSINSLLNYYDEYFITGSSDFNVTIWNYNFKVILSKNFYYSVFSLALIKNSHIAVGLDDPTIIIWNIMNNSIIKTLSGHKAGVNVLFTLPNGNLASGSYDYTIGIWDMNSYEFISFLNGHLNSIESLAALPNGNLLSGSSDKKIKLWDLDTFKCLSTITTDNIVNTLLVFNNTKLNNTQILSGTLLYKLWYLENLAFTSKLDGHKDQVTDLEFLPNENLISSSMDKSIILWDIATETQIASNTEHNRSVLALTYFSNEIIASGSEDKTIKIWQIDYHSPKFIKK